MPRTDRHGFTKLAIFQRYNSSTAAIIGLILGAALGSHMPFGTLVGALIGAAVGIGITALRRRKPPTQHNDEE